MKTLRIADPGGNGHYNMTYVGEHEYTNPVKLIMEAFVNHHIAFDRSFLTLKPELFSGFDKVENREAIMLKVIVKRALSSWNEEYERTMATPFPKETPHIHYISHAWGFTRAQAVAELKSRKYNFPWTVHIPYSRGKGDE